MGFSDLALLASLEVFTKLPLTISGVDITTNIWGKYETSGSAKHPVSSVSTRPLQSLLLARFFVTLCRQMRDSVVASFLANEQLVFKLNWNIQFDTRNILIELLYWISWYKSMAKGRNFITFEATDEEKEILKEYCQQEGRTQTDVLRSYIRTLKRKINKQGA